MTRFWWRPAVLFFSSFCRGCVVLGEAEGTLEEAEVLVPGPAAVGFFGERVFHLNGNTSNNNSCCNDSPI